MVKNNINQFRHSFNKKYIFKNIIINMILPIVLYKLLLQFSINQNLVIVIVALIPLFMTLFTFLIKQKINRISIITLLIIVFGVFLTFITGDERWILVKGSLALGGLGIVLTFSSIINKPLIVYLIQLRAKSYAKEKNYMTAPQVIKLNFLNFLVGVFFIIDALVHTYLIFHISTEKFLEITPFIKIINITIYLLIILWARKVIKDNMSLSS